MDEQKKTDEFSFLLKPSEHGVGVFAMHDIKEGTYLRLFGNEKDGERAHIRKKRDIPNKLFLLYCVDMGDEALCPNDFGAMPVGWYMNHSQDANAVHRDYHWYAARYIKEGEEVLADYNTLEEPTEMR